MGYEKDLTDWKSIRSIFGICDPAGARTQDPNIKSVVLYLLSYRVSLFLRLQRYYFFRYCSLLALNFFSFVQQSLALANDNYLIVSAVNYGTLLVFTCTTVDDDVHQVLVTVMNFLGVGEVGVDFVFLVGQ